MRVTFLKKKKMAKNVKSANRRLPEDALESTKI